MIAVGMVTLLAASWLDIRGKNIPLWITPVAFIPRMIYLLSHFNIEDFSISVFMGLILFIFYCFFARFGVLGGADCLMILLVGFYLGLYGLHAAFFATICSIPHMIIAYRRDKLYPYIPYIFLGYVLAVFYMCYLGEEIALWI